MMFVFILLLSFTFEAPGSAYVQSSRQDYAVPKSYNFQRAVNGRHSKNEYSNTRSSQVTHSDRREKFVSSGYGEQQQEVSSGYGKQQQVSSRRSGYGGYQRIERFGYGGKPSVSTYSEYGVHSRGGSSRHGGQKQRVSSVYGGNQRSGSNGHGGKEHGRSYGYSRRQQGGSSGYRRQQHQAGKHGYGYQQKNLTCEEKYLQLEGTQTQSDKDREWDEHRQKFNCPCTDYEICHKRRVKFEREAARIKQHNAFALCEQQRTNSTIILFLQIGPFACLFKFETDRDFRGIDRDQIPFHINHIFPPNLYEEENLPTSIDWRNKEGKDFVGPIRSQTCRSCWAFAATSALESHWAIKYGVDTLPDLSEQNILSCAHIENVTEPGCNGGWAPVGWEHLANTTTGQNFEPADPFVGHDCLTCQDQVCTFDDRCEQIGATVNPEDPYKWVKTNSTIALKAAIVHHGPVVVSVYSSGFDFLNYRTGILRASKCGDGLLDHAVVVVGYGEEEGVEFWIVRNSWGTNVGLGGYWKIEITPDDGGLGACRILQYPSYPQVGYKPDCSPPPPVQVQYVPYIQHVHHVTYVHHYK